MYRNKTRMSVLITAWEALARTTRQERKEVIQVGEEGQPSLLADGLLLYIGNPQGSAKKAIRASKGGQQVYRG